MSGIFGIFAPKEINVAKSTFYALYAIQHRGEESTGIASGDMFNHQIIRIKSGNGVVSTIFSEQSLNNLQGHFAIGQVSNIPGEIEPISLKETTNGKILRTIAVVMDGRITNSKSIEQKIGKSAKGNAQLFAELILATPGNDLMEKIMLAMRFAKGGYCAGIIGDGKLYALRNQTGTWPLFIGEIKNINGKFYCFSSETASFKTIGSNYLKEIQPGMLIVFDNDNLTEFSVAKPQLKFCMFEIIFRTRPDGKFGKYPIQTIREMLGGELAKKASSEADIVTGVPDSGKPAAVGYAKASKIPYEELVYKNRYIQHQQVKIPDRIKNYAVYKEETEGKRIILVEDSLVEANTIKQIIDLLWKAGAKEIHLKVTSPPVFSQCDFGMSSTEKNLLTAQADFEDLTTFLNVNSLTFLTEEIFFKVINATKDKFCNECLLKKPLG